MTTLYNLQHDGDQYRITKFHDDEVEASYLVTHENCDCPAGHRPTCRHRQMLPNLLPIIDTHWFWNFDTHTVVDLMGTPKATLDALIAPIVIDKTLTADCPPGCCVPAEQDTYGTSPFITTGGLEMVKAENERVHQENIARAAEVAKWRRI